jgi:hypothetical protein
MPVTKFRSAEEMNATPVAGDPADDFGRFLRHCARFRLIAPRSYPRGVFKFRDLPEAQLRERATCPPQKVDPGCDLQINRHGCGRAFW